MLFQRLIWCALGAALLVGSLQSVVQQWQAVPILRAAEVLEAHKAELAAAGRHAHDHAAQAGHHHEEMTAADQPDEAAWAPADGVERGFWTWTANVLHALGMALLVFAVMGLWVFRRCAATADIRLALAVAAAGWLSLHLWPSLGLPAEIPGMDAADLGARQAWWLLAAASAALACAMPAFGTGRWRWGVAVLLLALPFAVGAPRFAGDPLAGFGDEAHARMQQLALQFVWATTWVSLSFWAALGLVAGLVFGRWIRPVLSGILAQRAARAASPTQAAR